MNDSTICVQGIAQFDCLADNIGTVLRHIRATLNCKLYDLDFEVKPAPYNDDVVSILVNVDIEDFETNIEKVIENFKSCPAILSYGSDF